MGWRLAGADVAAQMEVFQRRAVRFAGAMSTMMGAAESWEDAACRTAAMMDGLVAELAERTSSWHAFDVLAWLQRENVAWAEGYQESTHEGLSALVELAALLVMDRPSAAATRRSGSSKPTASSTPVRSHSSAMTWTPVFVSLSIPGIY